MEYRGINLSDNVKLYKKNGDDNQKIKKGIDELIDMVLERGHSVESEYVNAKSKILINFNCGHKPHEIKPDHYKNGVGCPECGFIAMAGKRLKRSKDKFTLLLNSNGHSLLSEYLSTGDKVLIDFKCGHNPHWVIPDNYKRGSSCPKCAGLCPKQAKDDLICLLKSNGHLLLSDYVNAKTKVLIDFQCGHKHHMITPDEYKSGNRCPECSESKGEKRIRKWLVERSIVYETQKEFEGLSGLGGGLLSYDFYLTKQNILIEYQGKQHEQYIEGFHKSINDFIKQQEHDRRKREYAKNNGFDLLELWYMDFDNVEEILKDKLIIH